METKTATFIIEYTAFAIGERIRPCSRRCPMPDGVYIVTAFHAPGYVGDEATVFVAGEHHGMSAAYFTAADETTICHDNATN